MLSEAGVGEGVLDLRLNCWTVKLATHLHLEWSWKIRRVYIHITNVTQSKVLAFRKKFNFELGFLQINSLSVSERTLRVEFLTPIPCLSLHSLPRTCDTDLRHNNVRGMFLSFWIQMPPQGWTNLDILTDRTLCPGSASNGEQRWGTKYNLVAKLRVSATCWRTCLMHLAGLPVTETTPYRPNMWKVSEVVKPVICVWEFAIRISPEIRLSHWDGVRFYLIPVGKHRDNTSNWGTTCSLYTYFIHNLLFFYHLTV